MDRDNVGLFFIQCKTIITFDIMCQFQSFDSHFLN
jgi:hypothetical protein